MKDVIAYLKAEPGPCRRLWLIPLAMLAAMLSVSVAAIVIAIVSA